MVFCAGLSEDGEGSNVVFGFMTPSKRRGRPSLLQMAVTTSAQKKSQQQQQLDLETSPPPLTAAAKKTPTRWEMSFGNAEKV